MSASDTKRPNHQGVKSTAIGLQAPVSSLVAEPDLDFELCEKFSEWLIPELDQLVQHHAAFITPNSSRRDKKLR